MDVQLWTLCAATFKNLIWTLDEVNRFSRTMQGVAPSAPSAPPPTTETRTGETPRPRGLWWTTAQYHPETSDHLANLVTVRGQPRQVKKTEVWQRGRDRLDRDCLDNLGNGALGTAADGSASTGLRAIMAVERTLGL